MTHSKNLQQEAYELLFVAEEILNSEGMLPDRKRLEAAILATKDALQKVALEEGLTGGDT